MSSPISDAPRRLDPAWHYAPNPAFCDELLASDGQVRPHWQALVDSLPAIGSGGLALRWQEGRRLVHDHGVSYNVYGDPQSTDRPWPLDPIPLLVGRSQWEAIEAAVVQRATLLNSILADLYGPQR